LNGPVQQFPKFWEVVDGVAFLPCGNEGTGVDAVRHH
jgi:hypothetical protein